jgi:hypothetical protein
MLKKLSLMLAVTLMLTGAASLAGAQTAGGKGAGKLYNPQTVEVLSGTIEKMERRQMRRGTHEMLGFVLKTDKESVMVLLGPSRLIDKLAYKPQVGDQVTVKGSRVTRQSRTMIIAAEVRKGDQVMVLRDASGKPVMPPPRRLGGPGAGTGPTRQPGSGPGAETPPQPGTSPGTGTTPGAEPGK